MEAKSWPSNRSQAKGLDCQKDFKYCANFPVHWMKTPCWVNRKQNWNQKMHIPKEVLCNDDLHQSLFHAVVQIESGNQSQKFFILKVMLFGGVRIWWMDEKMHTMGTRIILVFNFFVLCAMLTGGSQEMFIPLNGTFKWDPVLSSTTVRSLSHCLALCLQYPACLAVYHVIENNRRSCHLLGQLQVGSVQRLNTKDAETWIRKSNSTQCPEEFMYLANGACYYLETSMALSWEDSKTRCKTLHWYSEMAQLETMEEFNAVVTAMASDFSGWVSFFCCLKSRIGFIMNFLSLSLAQTLTSQG